MTFLCSWDSLFLEPVKTCFKIFLKEAEAINKNYSVDASIVMEAEYLQIPL